MRGDRRSDDAAGFVDPAAAPGETPAASPDVARIFTDEADHEIVQRRLGQLYTVLGGIVTMLYVAGAAITAAFLPVLFGPIHRSTGKVLHLISGLGLLALGQLAGRGRLLPRWLLSTTDLLATATVMVIVGFIIAFIPKDLHPELLVLPVQVLVSTMRAALVPTPPRWTALVAAAAAVPGPVATYFISVHGLERPPVAAHMTLMATTGWSVASVIAAFAIARVIYGLRSQVKRAMRLGQYTLEEKIGEGGMGVVYRARHALLRRPTAIKLLSPERNRTQDIRRFEREVQLTSMLTHPNTVAIFDFGHTHDGVFYYAMEHLDGISLQDLVERDGAQPSGRVIHILAQLASALAEAHAIGLVHRDVKPANVFLCERGGLPDFVKVLDFGLVKHAGHSDPSLSHAGAIAGTPHYMAPESIKEPDSVDARVDIYALGVVGYFLLTGTTPFDGANLVEICSHHLHTTPEPPRERLGARVAPALEELVLACLAKTREERPASAEELVARLGACRGGDDWDLVAASEWWRREKRPASGRARGDAAPSAGAKSAAHAS